MVVVLVSGDANASAVKLACSPACREVVSGRDGISARGEFGVGVSAGAAFSVCAIDDCMVANGASLEVGPSSGSVDVDVFVRYNAVCKKTAGETHIIVELHFQTPKLGKSSSMPP